MASSPIYSSLEKVSAMMGTSPPIDRNDSPSDAVILEDFVTTFSAVASPTNASTNISTLAGNNTNTTDVDEPLVYAELYEWPIFVVVCILCSAAILGNSLLIGILYKIPGKKTHLLIVNLAIGDLGHAAIFLIHEILYKWIGHDPCFIMVIDAVFRLFDCVSILSLLALAITQTMAITRPLHYPSMVTHTRVWLTVLIIWLASSILPLIGVLVPLSDSNWTSCSWTHIAYDVTDWIFSVLLIVEVVVIVALYVAAFLQVQAYKNRQSELTQGMNMVQNRKAFLTTMIVLSTLVITWLPYLMFDFIVWNIMLKSYPDSVTVRHTEVYMNFIVFLPVINTISDPIIYGVRMPDVQRTLCRLCMCCQKKQDFKLNESTSSSLRSNTGEVNVAKNGNQFQMTPHHTTPSNNCLQNDSDTSAGTRL